MPISRQNLADALTRTEKQSIDGIVRGADISRKDRETLSSRGFLIEIIKGWYAFATPQSNTGDTVFWHTHFWNFANVYLKHRFGSDYCLSAEHSLDLWSGNTNTPHQLVVIAGKGGASTIQLPNGTSLLIYSDKKNLPQSVSIRQGVRLMPLAIALVRASLSFFRQSPATAEISLRLTSPDDLSHALLSESGSLASAARIIGALRACGLDKEAERLKADLSAAGADITETNPFSSPPQLALGSRFNSPYAARLRILWQQMSPIANACFPDGPGTPPNKAAYIDQLKERHASDAYNSLSIEGYQVTPELIAKIASGEWDPARDDNNHSDAMAAKGYNEAFKAVTKSVQKILGGKKAASVIMADLATWYRALFSPSVKAGILEAHALAGYRNRPVYIKGSRHAPPPHDAVSDLLDTYFELLKAESSPGAKAVLGHFFFVYIHPYSDGNGRIARFIMNALLAEGGYSWTVIRMANRSSYMEALEQASTNHDIRAFTRFIAQEMHAEGS